MLLLEVSQLELELLEDGELPLWIGSSVRGLVGRSLGDEVFQKLFRNLDASGGNDGTRMVVLAPDMLKPSSSTGGPTRRRSASRRGEPAEPSTKVTAGTRIPLTLLLAGEAIDQARAIQDALRTGGEAPGLEFANSPVPFRLQRGEDYSESFLRLDADDFVTSAETLPGRLPRVTVELTTPLRLKRQGRWLDVPEFSDLVTASMQVVLQLLKQSGEPLDFDRRPLLRQADRVPCRQTQVQFYSRSLLAQRGTQRHRFQGVLGRLTFADVPASLLPWLAWGGRLHVGDRRMSGAGGWRIVIT